MDTPVCDGSIGAFWSSGSGLMGGPCFEVQLLLLTVVILQRPKTQKKNSINYHLMRLYPKIIGPHKRK